MYAEHTAKSEQAEQTWATVSSRASCSFLLQVWASQKCSEKYSAATNTNMSIMRPTIMYSLQLCASEQWSVQMQSMFYAFPQTLHMIAWEGLRLPAHAKSAHNDDT